MAPRSAQPIRIEPPDVALGRKMRAETPMPRLRKRSILLAGHATSIALEPEFWVVLEEMATEKGSSLAALLTGLDDSRGDRPLASACRVAALAHARAAR